VATNREGREWKGVAQTYRQILEVARTHVEIAQREMRDLELQPEVNALVLAEKRERIMRLHAHILGVAQQLRELEGSETQGDQSQ
jgi:hypothetical protein